MDSTEFIDMVVSDAPSSEISDYIKGLLFAKSSEVVDSLKPQIAAGLFGGNEEEEVETEVEIDSQEEE